LVRVHSPQPHPSPCSIPRFLAIIRIVIVITITITATHLLQSQDALQNKSGQRHPLAQYVVILILDARVAPSAPCRRLDARRTPSRLV
jgi:hypothetical protein